MPSRRGTYLVLLGAALGALALAIPVAAQEPEALSSPEPVTPPSRTAPAPPTSTTRAADPTSPSPTSTGSTPPSPTTSARPTSSRPSSGRPTTSARPTSSSPGKSAASFRAVAGPACPVDASRWTSLSAGWEVIPGDSWTGDGCGDRFLYTASDSSNYVQWQFMFSTTTARTCRIEVFVPDSPLAQAKVRYNVADRGFTVDQKANRGRWARAVNVPVATATLAVRLDGDQGLTGVTAGPVRITCS